MGFAPNARNRVTEIGISDRELARQLRARGVKTSANTVSRWLDGKTEPPVSAARKLADLIGASLDALTDEGRVSAARPSPDERAMLTYIRVNKITLEEFYVRMGDGRRESERGQIREVPAPGPAARKPAG